MKIKFVVDSSSGLSEIEAKERGFAFFPFSVFIENEEFRIGIDMTDKEFFFKITNDSNLRTAAFSHFQMEEQIKKLSSKNDLVIIYFLSEHISSQTKNAKLVAKKFQNVFVVSSQGVGSGIINDIEIIKQISKKKNVTLKEIKEKIDFLTKQHIGILIPSTLNFLVKGGRIPPTIAKLADLIKIIPVIKFENGKLSSFNRGRGFKKTLIKSLQKLINDKKIDTKKYAWTLYHGKNDDIDEIVKLVSPFIPNLETKWFPAVIGAHIGPSGIAVIGSLKK